MRRTVDDKRIWLVYDCAGGVPTLFDNEDAADREAARLARTLRRTFYVAPTVRAWKMDGTAIACGDYVSEDA